MKFIHDCEKSLFFLVCTVLCEGRFADMFSDTITGYNCRAFDGLQNWNITMYMCSKPLSYQTGNHQSVYLLFLPLNFFMLNCLSYVFLTSIFSQNMNIDDS